MAFQSINRTEINVEKIRQEFPMLRRSIHGKPLLYLDNAGSSLKLRSVLDRQIGAMAKRHGTAFLVGGAQAAPHLPVDVPKIGCDFYAFSAHKMGGPTGVGVLYGRREWLEKLPPYQVGGVMVSSLSPTTHGWKPVPKKFEAGTEAIAEILAFGPAVKYWRELGLELVQYATSRLRAIPGIEIVGIDNGRVSIVSFTVDGMKPQDVELALDREGIIVRSGNFECAHIDAWTRIVRRRPCCLHVLQLGRRMRPFLRKRPSAGRSPTPLYTALPSSKIQIHTKIAVEI